MKQKMWVDGGGGGGGGGGGAWERIDNNMRIQTVRPNLILAEKKL